MRSDRDLQQDVADELDWDAAIDSHGLSVGAKAGIVTITGHVRHYSQQYEVERLAESIAGVREVIMRVEVQPKDLRDDAELARLAAVAVATTFDLGPNLIDIQVDNAWITLRGSVPWDFQRRNVVTAIGALRGVRGITNGITISAPDIPAGEIKAGIDSALQRLFDSEHQHVGVSVVHGDVTLTGNVTTGWQRNLVGRSAWNALGVRSVRNELVLYQ
jgi:osmotically-inducible protein OsmY